MSSSFGASAERPTEVSLSDLLNNHRWTRSIMIDNMTLAGATDTSLIHYIAADCLSVPCTGVQCRATVEYASKENDAAAPAD